MCELAMSAVSEFDIFLVAPPGLEAVLASEASALGFREPRAVPGGVEVRGGWPEVWRANLDIRGASRVLVRIGDFRAPHLAQLDKRARKFPWVDFLRADMPVRVEATCKSSRIYHAGAAAERIATAIHEELGAPIADDAEVAPVLRGGQRLGIERFLVGHSARQVNMNDRLGLTLKVLILLEVSASLVLEQHRQSQSAQCTHLQKPAP